MNEHHEIWETRLIEYLKSRQFAIVPTEGQCEPIKRVSMTNTWMTKAASSAAFGPLAAFASGITPNSNDAELVKSLRGLYELAALVGIRLATGSVGIALVIDADELEDEVLVGRCVLLQERISEFDKYGFKIIRTLFGDIKHGVVAYVFFVFRKPYKADHFLNNLSNKCKQVAFFKKIYTLPWAIDVAGRRVHKWKGFPLFDSVDREAMASSLFG